MGDYPDFSEWLDKKRFNHELENWRKDRHFDQYAALVDEARTKEKLDTIFEFGCGAGFVPRHLKGPQFPKLYTGLDKSFLCVQQALKETGTEYWPWLEFKQGDIRDWPEVQYDLVCSFAVLKHFSLLEFPAIMKKFLSMGRFGLFSTQTAIGDLDDGEEAGYHHIWVTEKNLHKAIQDSGHSVVWQRPRWSGEWHGTRGEEKYVFTKREE